MRTSKPCSTISYNSVNYLTEKLNELVRNKKICDYMFIQHIKECDETKDHIHLYIKPNTLIDTMEIQEHLKEVDLSKPNKPLGCIDFKSSKIDDWILYSEHYPPYLASKGESREYVYSKSDFVYLDEDTFESNYLHAFKGSEWAKKNKTLEMLTSGLYNPAELIENGVVPLNLAGSLNAYQYMKSHYGVCERGEHFGHE